MVLVATVVAAALTAAGVAVAVTGGNSGNLGIAEINTHDYKSEHKVGFSIVHLQGDTVDNQNAAYAESSGCTHCNATAIAVQVVLVQSNTVTTVAPQNFAFGVNQQCNFCTSAGLAYQYAISTDGNVHFSSDGNQQLSDLRQQIDDQAASITDDPSALQAAVDPLVHQMWSVVDTELVHSGSKYQASPYADFKFDKTGGQGPPSPSPTSSGSSSPSESISPSMSSEAPSQGSSPCVTPTESPAASPEACPSDPSDYSGGQGSGSSSETPAPSDSSTPKTSPTPESPPETSSPSP
ncbi:MAG: hypothetical protein ABR579_08840 [Actinomycetota bacterium]